MHGREPLQSHSHDVASTRSKDEPHATAHGLHSRDETVDAHDRDHEARDEGFCSTLVMSHDEKVGTCDHGDGCDRCIWNDRAKDEKKLDGADKNAGDEKQIAKRDERKAPPPAPATSSYSPPAPMETVISLDLPLTFAIPTFQVSRDEMEGAPGGAGSQGAAGGPGTGGKLQPPKGATAQPKKRQLPDINLQNAAHSGPDAGLLGVLNVVSSITRGGITVAPNFGLTTSTYPTLANINVTDLDTMALVTCDVRVTVKWDTVSGTGPSGEINVPSDTAAVINQGNYTQVADDLTPNMGDLGGRPPRSQYWAQDITELHEQFHANDYVSKVRMQAIVAQGWLATQRVPSYWIIGIFDSDVEAVLRSGLQSQIVTPWLSWMSAPAMEVRAYGSGVGLYTARASSIRAKGAANSYPAAPAAGP